MIPPWTGAGLLPPFVGASSAEIKGVSPYGANLLEVAQRFGTTPARSALLFGLLAWRTALSGIGLTGVQWLNGSFLEDIERTENRDPQDIDVVTFVVRPPGVVDGTAWKSFVAANANLFTPPLVKQHYGCDAYLVDVAYGPGTLLKQATYWYGLFHASASDTSVEGYCASSAAGR